MNAIDQPQSQNSPPAPPPPPKQEEDFSKDLTNLMPRSYREQSKRLLTYFTKNEHVQIDEKKNEVIILSKSKNLIYLASDMIANRKRLESYDSLEIFLSHQISQKVLLGINVF